MYKPHAVLGLLPKFPWKINRLLSTSIFSKTQYARQWSSYLPGCKFGQSLLDPERRRTGVRVVAPALGHQPGERLQGSRAL